MSKTLRERSFESDEPVRVSICCITFNHSDYIEKCLEGFLEQECDFRVEIMIYDDASTDGTADIIREYAARHPTIFRTFLQSENQYSKGVNPYYAYVFPATKGEYIAICDGDDFWSDPVKLATQVSVLDSEPETAITYGPVRAITDKGVIEDFHNGNERDLSPEELKAASPIATLTVCFRNIFRDTPPPVFLRNSPIGDLTVWGILGYHGSARYLANLPKANYRLHSGGVLSMKSRKVQYFMTALAHFNLAAYHSEQGDETASRKSMQSGVEFCNGAGETLFLDTEAFKTKSLWGLWRYRNRLRRVKKVPTK